MKSLLETKCFNFTHQWINDASFQTIYCQNGMSVQPVYWINVPSSVAVVHQYLQLRPLPGGSVLYVLCSTLFTFTSSSSCDWPNASDSAFRVPDSWMAERWRCSPGVCSMLHPAERPREPFTLKNCEPEPEDLNLLSYDSGGFHDVWASALVCLSQMVYFFPLLREKTSLRDAPALGAKLDCLCVSNCRNLLLILVTDWVFDAALTLNATW